MQVRKTVKKQDMNLEVKKMSRNRSLFHRLSALFSGLVLLMAMSMTAVARDNATSSKEYLDTLNV